LNCRSYIAGLWSDDASEQLVELGNPADRRETVSCSIYATRKEAAQAVENASSAWFGWRGKSVGERIALLERLVTAIVENTDDFARAINSETGKTIVEARQEVKATVAETRSQIELFRDGTVEVINGHQVRLEPLGAVLLITPSNFPLAAVMRKLAPALLAGNTAVVKASELTPLTASLLFAVLDDLGPPPGVANLILAEGREVVAAMIDVPDLRAISITGSNEAGEAIAEAIGGRDIRLQAEMGGSNAVMVLADADFENAATSVVEHGFSCCGQWCTGTSRVIIDETCFEEFTALLLQKVRQLKVGSGMGPLISQGQLERIEEAVAALVDAGASVLHGGKRPTGDELLHGNFYEPTILAGIDDYHALSDREIFGPVIALLSAASLDEAVSMANAGQFGLSFSVFTRDSEVAEQVVSRIDSGLCHVNQPTGFRDNTLPLAGWKRSGRGHSECGRFARDFFTQTKSVYRAAS
jgi:acyl-CoA reductase-like NAD-dependent aldehyde dehydrogenase